MINLISGPGCFSNTKLAWQFLKQRNIPFFNLDYLVMGLHYGAPALGVDPKQPESLETPKIWQICKPMVVT